MDEKKPAKAEAGFVYNPHGETELINVSVNAISFRLVNTAGARGEIKIPARQSRPVPNSEIKIKIEEQNPSICGTDGLGSNAALVIGDAAWRRTLGFDGQKILTDELLAEMAAISNVKQFEAAVKKNVITTLEKAKFIEFLRGLDKKGNFDSAAKRKFAEEYCGQTL